MSDDQQPLPSGTPVIAKRRRALWPWSVAAIVLAVSAAVLSFWWPMHEAGRIITLVKSQGGTVGVESDHPGWLPFLGEETFHPWFDTATSVYFGEIIPDDNLMDEVTMFPDLEFINVNSEKLSASGLAKLGQFPKLERLFLEGNGKAVSLQFVASLPNLEQLMLNGIPISKRDWESVLKSKSLEWLSFRNADLDTSVTPSPVPENCVLSQTTLDTEHGEAFRALTSLSWIQLDECQVSPGFWAAISSHPKLNTLELLNVELSDESTSAFCRLPALETLGFAYGAELNARQIRTLSELKSVKTLRFYCCWFADDVEWDSLAKIPGLEHVEFISAAVGDDAAAALGRCPRLTTLTMIDSELTDMGLKLLEGAPSLKELIVNRSKVTPAGVKAFEAARSGVEVSAEPDVPRRVD